MPHSACSSKKRMGGFIYMYHKYTLFDIEHNGVTSISQFIETELSVHAASAQWINLFSKTGHVRVQCTCILLVRVHA